MKLLFWKTDQESSGNPYAPHEEIDAKRTSKLGYFFLILMVLFGVWQGNNLLSSIQAIIDLPPPNTSCAHRLASYADFTPDYYSHYSNYYDGEDCTFTKRETELGLDVIYAKVKPWLLELKSLDQQIQGLEAAISDAAYQRRNNINEYQAALVEDIATKTTLPQNDILNTSSVGDTIRTTQEILSLYKTDLTQTQSKRAVVEQKIRAFASLNTAVFEEVEARYQKELQVYELSVFLVSVILIVPLFYFSWRKYNASRERRSEYAIIWGGVVATFGLMTAQILLVFVYEIIPHQILQEIFQFLSSFKIIWTLLYWLAFILVPAFFGLLIYLIQKKFYNPQAVLMRALKSGHCPQCSLKVLPTMNNCPICGFKLKTKCETCNNMSLHGGSFCEVCGTRRPD